MINHVYRLTDKQQIEGVLIETSFDSEHVLVRPTYLSICAADQRYYQFQRPYEVMMNKLPMALIHEAIGEIVYDPLNLMQPGQSVILIPTLPSERDSVVSENYLKSSKFCSSNHDGFLQEIVKHPRDRLLPFDNDLPKEVMAFAELISICLHAVTRFESRSHKRRNRIGIWGDGNVGFITALLLRLKLPDAEIIIFGKHRSKLDYFTFTDQRKLIGEDMSQLRVDHAFECVGGQGSEAALRQIIDIIEPEGHIALLGVSEEHVEVNTRMCLEKGLLLAGNSRSAMQDYRDMLALISTHHKLIGYLKSLVSAIPIIRNIQDIHQAFETDLHAGWGKTILKWEI